MGGGVIRFILILTFAFLSQCFCVYESVIYVFIDAMANYVEFSFMFFSINVTCGYILQRSWRKFTEFNPFPDLQTPISDTYNSTQIITT